MGGNEKKKQIVLIVAIVSVIVIGVLFFLKTWNIEDKNEEMISQSTQEMEKVEETEEVEKTYEDDRLYYIEEPRGEEVFEDIRRIWIHIFKGKPVRISKNPDTQKMSLMDMNTGDYIYEFVNVEMFDYDGLWIDENNIFWTIKYDWDLKQTIVKSFDESGKEENLPVILEDFMGAAGFEEIEDRDLYLDIRHMNTDDNNLYFTGHALKLKDESFFQAYSKDGKLLKTFISANKGIELDKKGNLFLATEGQTYYSGVPSGNPDVYGYYFLKFNGENFEEIYHKATPEVIGNISYNEFNDKIYTLHPFETQKIFSYAGEDGQELEEIFAFGEDSSYMSVNSKNWVCDFHVGDNEEIYIALQSSFDEALGYSYEFFAYPGKAKINKIERKLSLTITAPFKQDFLVNAIKEYELKYPEERIEYNYIYNNGESFLSHKKQYAEQLAMDILTGEIGDVVAMGSVGLFYEDVFKTDVFEDLIPYLEKDPNYSELNKNALDAIRIDNSIKGIPASFSYYSYEMNKELIDVLELDEDYDNLKWSDILKWRKLLSERVPDAHLFVGKDIEKILLNEILMSNMNDLIDFDKNKSKINQKWFVNLISEFKECLKTRNFALESPGIHLDHSMYDSLFRITSNYGKSYRDQMKYFAESNVNGTKKTYIPLFKGEKNSNRRGHSDNIYSINARSERKESSWKFLSFLMEQDSQQDNELMGTPLNIVAEKKLGSHYKYIFENQYPVELSEEFEKMSINNSKKIDFFDDVNYFKKDIGDPITQYLNDEITLKVAIKQAQENVNLRLNE